MLKRLRSTPLPPHAYLGAVLASTLVVFVLQTVALFAIGGVALRHARCRPTSCSLALLRRCSASPASRPRVRRRRADPLGGGVVGDRERDPAADGVPVGLVRPDRHYPRFLRADRRRSAAQALPRHRRGDLPGRRAVWSKPGASPSCRLGRPRTRRRGPPFRVGAAGALSPGGASLAPTATLRARPPRRPRG